MRACLIAVIFVLELSGGLANVCGQYPTVRPGDPRLPQALPPTFQVSIAATIANSAMDGPRSVMAHEYMDSAAGRSAFYLFSGSLTQAVLVNTNTNESYHITTATITKGPTCIVENAITDYTDVINGGPTGSKERIHAFSSSAMLRFAQKYGEAYIGSTVVRGVPVDHWRTCMYWNTFKANFTLDYYFSLSNWTTTTGVKQVPVRAEITGTNSMTSSSTPFHHIYDYFDFKNYLDDSTKLETPKGVVCSGRKHTRPVPKLSNDYRFRMERKTVKNHTVTNGEIWYDYDFYLLRADYRPPTIKYPTYSLDPVTEIHDYQTGVAYVIDKVRKNCIIIPIENGTLDATRSSGFTEQLKSPQKMFTIDNTYSYSGQRVVRDIKCDVYSKIEPYPTHGTTVNVTFELYFLARTWQASSDVGSNNVSLDVPIRLEVSVLPLQISFYMSMDFYNFDPEPSFFNLFDISPCFGQTHIINFEITFPGNYAAFLKKYQIKMMDLGMFTLSNTAQISGLRFQNFYVHWDNNNAYLIGSIVDGPPALAEYHHWKNKVADFKDNVQVQSTDPKACADMCNRRLNGTCSSFDICPKAGTCSLSVQYTSDGAVLKHNPTCDHYSRVVPGKASQPPTVQAAWTAIKNAVNSKKFQYLVYNSDTSQEITFKAASIWPISYTPGVSGSPRAYTGTGSYHTTPGPGSTRSGCLQQPNQPSSQAGAIAGAAIGMLILGLLLGVGGVILFNKKRGQGPDVRVSYSNNSYKE